MQDMLCDGVTDDWPKLWQSRILCGSAQAYAVLSDPEPPFTHEANIPPECMYKNSLLEESMSTKEQNGPGAEGLAADTRHLLM